MEDTKQKKNSITTCNDCLEVVEGESYSGLCFECAVEMWDEYLENIILYGGDVGFLYRQ